MKKLKIEIRADHIVVDGYVNAVGRDSRVLPKAMCPEATTSFVEQVVPKTFERALQKGNTVELRFNHRRTLGTMQSGDIELYEDEIGLRGKATITDPEVIQKAKNGELRGWSFGFVPLKNKWEEKEDGVQRRYLEEIELREVSILDKTPAYIATSIEMRGDDCVICEERSCETSVEFTDSTPKSEEKRDYSLYQKQIEILKMRGRK